MGSAGAIAKNKIASERCLKEYYENPSVCKECNIVIHPIKYGNKYDYAGAKIKKFCSRSCSAKYNNKDRELDPDFIAKRNLKKEKLASIKAIYSYNECNCGELKKKKAKTCIKCTGKYTVGEKTYKQFKDRYKDWWNSRVPIAKDARRVFNKSNKPKECVICGYNKHIQVCHIKAVSDFDENTLVKEINSIDNLVALCPNHHWEYDNGLIEL